MRLVVQRVSEAKVTIDGQIAGAIQQGLLVLLGIHKEDKAEDIPWFINKLINLRIFSDEQGKLNLSIKDIKGQILLVSQFTLYGNCLNGRRPDFIQAAPPAIALPLYHQFIKELSQEVDVQTGRFGAAMQVALVNEGPVTLIIEPGKRGS
jgi:D-tyrosyl-tRNA(Tyr) deacylase